MVRGQRVAYCRVRTGTLPDTAEESMARFVIEAHFRLQEWVAEDKGYSHYRGEVLRFLYERQRRPADAA